VAAVGAWEFAPPKRSAADVTLKPISLIFFKNNNKETHLKINTLAAKGLQPLACWPATGCGC